MDGEDKHWAQKHLIDPLHEPEPSAETGPGSSFLPSNQPPQSKSPTKAGASMTVKEHTTGSSKNSTNPYRRSTLTKDPPRTSGSLKSGASTRTRAVSATSAGNPFDQHSSRSPNPQRASMLGVSEFPQRPGSADGPRGGAMGKLPEVQGRRRRASSLKQRYPGDPTDHPLDMLTRDSLRSQRSPHLRKKHQPRPDQIDSLDDALGKYHHEGPYDAALMVRNSSYKNSPIAALRESNNEALKATPADKIRDSLNDHRPLDGVAMVPPGHADAFGRRYDYQEGTDMMRDLGGNYKRWPGVTYLPEDLKGKGEPSYTIEEDLKKRDAAAAHQRHTSANGNEYELAERPRHFDRLRRDKTAERPRNKSGDGLHVRKSSDSTSRRLSKSPGKDEAEAATTSGQQRYSDWEADRRHSRGKNLSGEIKRRFGSLSKKDS